MSEAAKISVKKWLFGAGVSLFLAALAGGTAWYTGATWGTIIPVFCLSAATHFGAWMKQHPIETIDL